MILKGMRAKKERAGEGGFTLIELLVVIVILGILAAVVVFAVGGVGDKGNESACTIDTRTLRTSLEANFAQNNTYAAAAPTVDWNVVATPGMLQPAPGAAGTSPVNESQLVTGGFLSEESDMHAAEVVDVSNQPGIIPGIRVLVQDGASPGNDCGNVGAITGTSGVAPGTPSATPENI